MLNHAVIVQYIKTTDVSLKMFLGDLSDTPEMKSAEFCSEIRHCFNLWKCLI